PGTKLPPLSSPRGERPEVISQSVAAVPETLIGSGVDRPTRRPSRASGISGRTFPAAVLGRGERIPGSSSDPEAANSGRQPLPALASITWGRGADVQLDAPRRRRFRTDPSVFHRPVGAAPGRGAGDLRRDRAGSANGEPCAAIQWPP